MFEIREKLKIKNYKVPNRNLLQNNQGERRERERLYLFITLVHQAPSLAPVSQTTSSVGLLATRSF